MCQTNELKLAIIWQSTYHLYMTYYNRLLQGEGKKLLGKIVKPIAYMPLIFNLSYEYFFQ